MKKLLFILSFFALAFVGQAQDALKSPAYSNTLDTVTNTGTKYLAVAVKNAPNTISLTVVITKLTGTGAGTAVLQGSNDGTNYFTCSSDTFTITNVTSQNYGWTVTNPGYAYYRINVTGSGTESITIQGKYVSRKP